nr:MAG TPA: hypothetical protein [Caudoviricetes sp.]
MLSVEVIEKPCGNEEADILGSGSDEYAKSIGHAGDQYRPPHT